MSRLMAKNLRGLLGIQWLFQMTVESHQGPTILAQEIRPVHIKAFPETTALGSLQGKPLVGFPPAKYFPISTSHL